MSNFVLDVLKERAAEQAGQIARQEIEAAKAFGGVSGNDIVIGMPKTKSGQPRFASRSDGAEAGMVTGGAGRPTLG